MDPAPFPANHISERLLQLPVDLSLAFVFPGQGSQKIGMGNEVRAASPVAREVFSVADEVAGFPLSDVCANGPDDDLTRTDNAQPAILTTAIAVLGAGLESGAITARPAYVAGHSLGQYTSLVAAGSLELAEAVRLVRERGRLMGAATVGTMAAVVGLEEAVVEALCAEAGAEIANYNGPTQTVVGGSHEAVEKACALAKEKGGRGIAVNVSGAFHTTLMEDAAREFAKSLQAASFAEPRIPVIGNVTAKPLTSLDELMADLSQHMRSPVRWYQSLDWLEANGVTRVVEIGGKLLTAQIKRSNPDLEAVSLDEQAALGKAASSV